ncbi:hypothetical protein [Halobacillus litoralis]|uniref:hypothetical protein n=1 Tax=Halobacillus litoralis TaxID=45668 RepID=UPI0039A75955
MPLMQPVRSMTNAIDITEITALVMKLLSEGWSASRIPTQKKGVKPESSTNI